MERIINAIEENSNRENIMKVCKNYTIEYAIVVIEESCESQKAQYNKFLLEKTVSRCCA